MGGGVDFFPRFFPPLGFLKPGFHTPHAIPTRVFNLPASDLSGGPSGSGCGFVSGLFDLNPHPPFRFSSAPPWAPGFFPFFIREPIDFPTRPIIEVTGSISLKRAQPSPPGAGFTLPVALYPDSTIPPPSVVESVWCQQQRLLPISEPLTVHPHSFFAGHALQVIFFTLRLFFYLVLSRPGVKRRPSLCGYVNRRGPPFSPSSHGFCPTPSPHVFYPRYSFFFLSSPSACQ